MATRVGYRWRFGFALVSALLAVASAATSARAAGRVFWTDEGTVTVSSANLDGSGAGSDLSTTGASLNQPSGTTIDVATGRIYWVDQTNDTVSFANLDGSGGGTLNTKGASVVAPEGVAVDPATGKLYWANEFGGSPISFANLDGSGGGNLDVDGANPDKPSGLAIDPAGGKVYWANFGNDTISYANLNDSGGGGQLNLSGAVPAGPAGVAIDPTAGRIYWTNYDGSTISFARLDGTGGGGQVITKGAMIAQPWGLAIDPMAGRLYWANWGGGGIGSVRLAGGGAGNLSVAPLTPANADFPSLLKIPASTAAPAVSGASTQGSTLACSPGAWASDLIGSYLYQSPRSLAYGWTVNGAPVTGAVSSSIAATAPGTYVCQVTATNAAGSTQVSSAGHAIAATLKVTRHGSGLGTVTSTPGAIACGKVCSASYPPTMTITLKATAARGSKFAGWAGACSGRGACHLAMTANRSVTATFRLAPPNTRIVRTRVSSSRRRASFRFRAVGHGTAFMCSLVKPARRHHRHARPSFRACHSPKRYRDLKAGRYTFSVRAANAGGHDRTPATRRFTIHRRRPTAEPRTRPGNPAPDRARDGAA